MREFLFLFRMRLKKSHIFLLIILLFYSCSTTKYVPDGDFLLNRIRIKSNVKNVHRENVSPYFWQQPNAGIFGVAKLKLGIYNLSGQDTSKWINKTLRKIGEAPVIYDEYRMDKTREQIEKYLSNRGYINAEVEKTETKKKKKISLSYTLHGGTPYKIRAFTYSISDSTISAIILGDTINSLVKKDNLFDVDILDAERQRISTLLKRDGYYYFNKEYLHFSVDSALNNHQVDIEMNLRPMFESQPDGSMLPVAHRRMKVGKVSFMPWYNDEISTLEQRKDTVKKDDFWVYYPDKKRRLRAGVMIDNNHIEPNNYYNENDMEQTYSRLNTLPIVKYVNISFREHSHDTINCLVITSPTKTQAVSFDIEGTNSSSDFGIAAALGYQHRNIFKGSELLSVKLRGGYEGIGNKSSHSFEAGGEAAVRFPEFLFPFLKRNFRKNVRASTEIRTQFSFQTRPEFQRILAGAGLKYLWQGKNIRYSCDLVDFNYVHLPDSSISQKFREDYLNQTNSIVRYSYEDHLIMRIGFSLFNDKLRDKHTKANYMAYRAGIETAGNLLYGIASAAKLPRDGGGYKIAGIRFSQYVKGDFDFAYNHVIDKNNRLIYHFDIGVAYPYGNADVLPFEKRYFAGGANSVRGWGVRKLGPGIYKSENTNGKIDFMQLGDIKIDLNLEYRFKLFWVLEGALFVDGGNVWTIKDYKEQPGGLFKFNEFYKQMAYSYGIGLRLDFNFFVVRMDMGVKLFDPSKNAGEKWRTPAKWEEYAFHFAVGYPF